MPPRILAAGRMPDWIVARMRRRLDVLHGPDGVATLDAATRAGIGGAAAFGGADVFDAPTLDLLPNLGVIANFGTGYDRIDVPEARRRGIALAYLPGIPARCVADHAMGLILALGRGIVAGHRYVESGEWLDERYPLTHRVSGRRLGIYGLGDIGRAIARRAEAFDMPVAYHNRRLRADVPHLYLPSLRELAAWSDILVIACPATPETIGSVDASVLAALGRDGTLVNIARGSIVDEAALADALDADTIAGAALDVFETEPCLPERLVGRDNVVLTPHVGGGTIETWTDATDRLVANLEGFFATGQVLDPIP